MGNPLQPANTKHYDREDSVCSFPLFDPPPRNRVARQRTQMTQRRLWEQSGCTGKELSRQVQTDPAGETGIKFDGATNRSKAFRSPRIVARPRAWRNGAPRWMASSFRILASTTAMQQSIWLRVCASSSCLVSFSTFAFTAWKEARREMKPTIHAHRRSKQIGLSRAFNRACVNAGKSGTNFQYDWQKTKSKQLNLSNVCIAGPFAFSLFLCAVQLFGQASSLLLIHSKSFEIRNSIWYAIFIVISIMEMSALKLEHLYFCDIENQK